MAPTEVTTPAAPTQAPTTGQGVFIPQPVTGQTKNISESPILSSPAQNSGKSGTKTPGNKKIPILIGLVIAILLVLGSSGIYFTRTRQTETVQTSNVSTTAKLNISPPSGTVPGDTEQSVDFSLDFSATPVSLTDLEFSVAFAGQVPSEIKFNPTVLENFNPADVSVTDIEAGKKLTVIYKAPVGKSFSATTAKLNLGTLTFISPESGQMTIRFSASDSKAIISQSGIDILRPANLITYTFESPITPTPDNPLISSVTEASTAANEVTPTTTPEIKISSVTAGPTASTIAINTAVATKTPSPTKTSTPTATIKPSATLKASPTPTSTRQSSLPAETQEKPVSGSVDVTVGLLTVGFLFIITGFVTWKRSSHTVVTKQD